MRWRTGDADAAGERASADRAPTEGAGARSDADPEAMSPAVEVSDVSVELGGSRVLDSVSATVEPGRFVGLVGPNGAGKTTLIRTSNGRVDPAGGRVSVAGRPVAERSPRAMARLVATVPQRTELAFSFPVRAVVEMGRFPHRPRLGWDDPGADLIEWAMERTGIAHLADRPVTETSGGERQRVLLARALAQDSPVLLLDEPTASLDVNHQVRTLGLVRELVDREDRTAIAAIHDLDLAARFCDELVLLAGGRVRASGPPEDVLTEESVESAFETEAAVGRNPVTGSATVTALPARTAGDRRGRVHVVGGGGRGAPLLHRLSMAGYEVTTGVLHDDDPDHEAARALDVEAVTVEPFTSVESGVEAALELVERADVTVLGDVEVGPANAGNLVVAGAAERLVVVDERPFRERNHAGAPASNRYGSMIEDARLVAEDAVVAAVAEEVAAARKLAADGGE